jgi:hypothetical protein
MFCLSAGARLRIVAYPSLISDMHTVLHRYCIAQLSMFDSQLRPLSSLVLILNVSAHILARRAETFSFSIFRDGGPECIREALCNDLP